MNIFNIPYDKLILIGENKEHKQRVYLQKTQFKVKNKDHYFIKLLKPSIKGNLLCQGYIYFYFDLLKKESNFIGVYVDEKYRNQGIAQLLISYWIIFCFDNGIYNLDTNIKQRKPFILYLLKKFKFDILNINEYETSPNTISICKKENSLNKYLYFKNIDQKETFIKGNIKNEDNYIILDKITDEVEVLDRVLLSTPYISKETNIAYTKSLTLVDKFKNI